MALAGGQVTDHGMRQRWRSLLFVHAPVAPEVVAARLPAGLEPDLLDGQAWVSMVFFRMEGIQFVGMPPIPGATAFPEFNVRTYARHVASGKTGVWFDALLASQGVAVAVARRTFGLPYVWARSMRVTESDTDCVYAAGWRGQRFTAACEVGRSCGTAMTERERWLVERYRLFSVRRGVLCEGLVDHRPYPLCGLRSWRADGGMATAFGYPELDFGHAHFSRGVDVRVGRLTAVSDN